MSASPSAILAQAPSAPPVAPAPFLTRGGPGVRVVPAPMKRQRSAEREVRQEIRQPRSGIGRCCHCQPSGVWVSGAGLCEMCHTVDRLRFKLYGRRPTPEQHEWIVVNVRRIIHALVHDE